MIARTILYCLVLSYQCSVILCSHLSNKDEGSVSVYSGRQGFGYNEECSPEEFDSKDRRCIIGTSFIRFGRSEKQAADLKIPKYSENNLGNTVRFGRSGFKSQRDRKAERARKILHADLQELCVLPEDELYLARIVNLCDALPEVLNNAAEVL